MLAALAIGVLALTGSPVLAQSGAALVDEIFATAEAEFGLVSASRDTGRIPEGGQTAVFFNVAPGAAHILMGACDEYCSDLDLVVRDPAGVTVGVDRAPDDSPVVEIPAGAGGRYTFQVEMAGCMSDCHWGVRSYNIGAPAESW